MSKKGFISRYLMIMKRLKTKPYSSSEELQRYIESQLNYLQLQDDTLEIGFSTRTLQRDIQEIRNVFGIDIKHSKKEKGYFINHSASENMNFQRIIEAFEVFNSLNIAQDVSPYLHLENKKPQGTENLYGIIHSIKNRYEIKFTYHKFWEGEGTFRTVEPYALREFKNRWYIIAKDHKEGNIKSFALDRISQIQVSNTIFAFPAGLDIEKSYQHCFGIINPFEGEPQKIVLSFGAFQGKYIKTLPLHHTQQILIDNELEFRIQLHLYITHDFVMEILSFGDSVKVVAPQSLVENIKEKLEAALKNYE